MESRNELKYELKEELRKCYACNDWIHNTTYRLQRGDRMLYFHEFCFYCITGKNPNYKSVMASSIRNTYPNSFLHDARSK